MTRFGKIFITSVAGVIVLVGLLAVFIIRTPATDMPPETPAAGTPNFVYVTGTPPDAVTQTPPPTATPSPTPAAAAVTATAEISYYRVQDGDALWSIALALNVAMEQLIDLNPNMNPDLLRAGQMLTVPGDVGTDQPYARLQSLDTSFTAYYIKRGADDRLLVMDLPGEGGQAVVVLTEDTPLYGLARSADYNWLQVELRPALITGWVRTADVDMIQPVASFPRATSPDDTTAEIAAPVIVPVDYPYIHNITPNARAIFEYGQSIGNRANVFSKIGDSITDNPWFLVPVGRGEYELGAHAYLLPVIKYFSQALALTDNSFANDSIAAVGGWSSYSIIRPLPEARPFCPEGDSVLACEYRWVKPSIALILLGTNDVGAVSIRNYESNMRRIIEESIENGVIPIVSTIPAYPRLGPSGEPEKEINDLLYALGSEYGVPIWDYWAATQSLPNQGLSTDRVHPSVLGNPADFSPEGLEQGMNMRNLTALQALDAVWRAVYFED